MATPAQTTSAAPFDSIPQNEAKPISLSRKAIIWIVVIACMVIAAFVAVTVLLCRCRRRTKTGGRVQRGYSVTDGRNDYKAWHYNAPLPPAPIHDLPPVPTYGGYGDLTPLTKAAVRPAGSAVMEPMVVENAGEGSGFQRKSRTPGGRYYSGWTGRISSRFSQQIGRAV